MDYTGALERARQHRDQYEQQALENARAADRNGYSNPNMFSNEMRTMSQNNASRFAAQASPMWDAYFQLAQEGGWTAPTKMQRQRPARNVGAAVSGLQSAASPMDAMSTDDLIEQSQASRAQGNKILQREQQESTKSKAAYQSKFGQTY